MSAGLDDILKAIQDIVGAVTGIRAAPYYAPPSLPPGVSSIVLPDNGTFEEMPAQVKKGLHNVTLLVVCPRADSQKLLEKIIPFGDAVAVALMNDRTLGATCSTYGALSYTFGGINWAAAPGEPPDGIGFTFTISDIKHNDATSLESE